MKEPGKHVNGAHALDRATLGELLCHALSLGDDPVVVGALHMVDADLDLLTAAMLCERRDEFEPARVVGAIEQLRARVAVIRELHVRQVTALEKDIATMRARAA